jgi:putative restriction endonuclease
LGYLNILPDAADGEASVRNGIAMSALHHAAYEQHLIGIDPEGVVHVSKYVQKTRDGPLLDHGLQRLDGRLLRMPSFAAHQPNPEFLSVRYKDFLKRWA